MEFSLGRDTLPSQARSVRGESRRLRRERDNAKKPLSRCLVRRIAQRDHCGHNATSIQRDWRTAADVKSVHDRLSRHHAGRKSNRYVSISAPARAHTCRGDCRDDKRAIAAVSLRLLSALPSACPAFAPSPLAPQPDGLVRIISMAVRDHASLVAHSNHNLAGTTVIKPSQR